MRCFVHHDQEAIGVCCVCGKGLCPDCAVDLGHALSCRGACEQQARAMHTQSKARATLDQVIQNQALLSQQSQALMRLSRRARFLTPFLFIVIGGILALTSFIGHTPFYFIRTSIGILFFAIGFALLVFQLSLFKSGKP